ncbi:MAG TPA: biopolymer transporter Tol [Candidatus Kapabacteria bacterium]|nr:biopolymer transporter Tol [Candidatus Kapabacteria bacterium]
MRLRGFAVVVLLTLCAGSSVFAQSTNFGKNKVQYSPFHWRYIQSPHFDIYFYDGGEELAAFTAERAEIALVSIEHDLRYDLGNRVSILIYNSHNDFQQTNAVGEYLPEGVGGVTELFKNRVILPFEGNYELFRHVIHHELVHAVINDMFTGGNAQSLLMGSGFMIPSWMNEGLAEYESLHGLDGETDMFMRDATLSDAIPSLSRLGGYVQYRVGQTMYWYIADKYGPEKVGELLNRLRTLRSPEMAFRSTFGLGVSDFSDKFIEALKKRYYPDIARYDNPTSFAEELANHKKLGDFFNAAPEVSPDGKYLAFISDRSDFYDVYIQDLSNPRDIKKVLSGGGASASYEELHLLSPGLCWSPDGKKLALASKAGRYDLISIIDVESDDIKQLPDFNVDAIGQLAWSPDGKTIAFIAYKSGASDVYTYDFETNKAKNLTHDVDADQDPAWGGDSKTLYFTSDRENNLTPGSNPIDGIAQAAVKHRQKDLYRLDITTNSITRITATEDRDEFKPTYAAGQKALYFISNANGINNIFVASGDSSSARPLTNSLSKIEQISVSTDGSKLAFCASREGGYNLYLLRNPIDRHLDSLPSTTFKAVKLAEAQQSDSAAVRISEISKHPPQSAADSAVGYGEVDVDLHNYVYSANPDQYKPVTPLRRAPLETITNYKDSNGKYIARDYKIVFSPDIILGSAGYTGSFGLQGSMQMLFSDELGNHQLYFASNLLLDIKNSDFVLAYFDMENRTNYGLQAFHSARFIYTTPDAGYEDYNYFVSRFTNYGLTGLASYPFDHYTRLDMNLSAIVLERDVIDNAYGLPLNLPTKRKFAVVPGASYIYDDVLWSYFYPKAGTRYNIGVSAAPKLSDNMLGFVTPQFDIRHYIKITGDLTLATRFAGAASFGPTPQKFFVGGVDGWINRYFSPTAYPLTEPQDFAFYTSGTPLRGFAYDERIGTKYGIVNAALRFPFPIYVSGAPLALLSEVFMDAGTAFNDKVYLFQKKDDGTYKTRDLLLSTGIGFRTYLLGFYLKMDIAWATTLDTWKSPQYIFSIAEDF